MTPSATPMPVQLSAAVGQYRLGLAAGTTAVRGDTVLAVVEGATNQALVVRFNTLPAGGCAVLLAGVGANGGRLRFDATTQVAAGAAGVTVPLAVAADALRQGNVTAMLGVALLSGDPWVANLPTVTIRVRIVDAN